MFCRGHRRAMRCCWRPLGFEEEYQSGRHNTGHNMTAAERSKSGAQNRRTVRLQMRWRWMQPYDSQADRIWVVARRRTRYEWQLTGSEDPSAASRIEEEAEDSSEDSSGSED